MYQAQLRVINCDDQSVAFGINAAKETGVLYQLLSAICLARHFRCRSSTLIVVQVTSDLVHRGVSQLHIGINCPPSIARRSSRNPLAQASAGVFGCRNPPQRHSAHLRCL